MADGRSAGDIAQRAQVGTLTRNGVTGAPQDALATAYSDVRTIAATKLITRQATELEADQIKAENDLLKAQIESRQLREEAGTAGGEGAKAGWTDYLIAQLERAQAESAASQQQAMNLQRQMLEDRMAMLREELTRSRTAEPATGPVNSIDAVRTTIQEAREIVDLVTPPPPPAVSGLSYDPGFEKWKLTIESQNEIRRLEFEERRWQMQQDLDLKRETLAREQARLDQQASTQERALAETLPKILTLVEQGITAWQQRMTVVAPTAAPAAVPPPVGPSPEIARAPVTLPPGVESTQCPTCGATMLYKQTWAEVICSHCAAIYTNSAPSTQEAANGVASHSGDPGTT